MNDPFCPQHGTEPTAYDHCSCPPYPWPCGRRVAHHAHDDVDATLMTNAQIELLMRRPADLPSCPGVEAHPSTMAGGSWRKW